MDESDESIGIGNSSLVALFFQVEAGSEFSVVEKLHEQGHTNVYKAFGQYDIVSYFDVNSLEDEKIYASCEGVHVSRAVTAYNLVSPTYQSPDIEQWSYGTPILGFIFLELDKWFYSPGSGSDSSLSAYSKVIAFLKKIAQDNSIELAIFGGYGRSELYAIVKTTNIEDIWKVTRACRSLKAGNCFSNVKTEDENLPVFVNTRTIPCISYEFIKYDAEKIVVQNVTGNCSAVIAINCHSGFEDYIASHFPEELGYKYTGLLGNDDGIIYTTKALETKNLIEKILQFRQEWSVEHEAPIYTRTLFQDTLEFTIDAKSNAKGYHIENKEESIKIPTSLQKNNPRLANRIKNFTHNINSYYCNRTHQVAVLSISRYMDYIRTQIEHYQHANLSEKSYEIFSAESKLLEAIETAETGLAQRIGSNFDSINAGYEIPLPFGDGIFANLIAVEHYINYIFKIWSDNNVDYQGRSEGNGFPTFNDSFGFLMGWGETFNLPLVGLYDPCDTRGNWLTLTHEISHAIYIRVNFGIEHKDALEEIRIKCIQDGSKDVTHGDDFTDQVFELFAHWYDYYHFYDAEFDKYLIQVWNSWLLIPIVHINFTNYFSRNLFVYFVHSEEEIKNSRKQGTSNYSNVLNRLWNEHLQKVKTSINKMPMEYIEIAKENKKKLLKLFTFYYPIIELFQKYQNEAFRKNINKDYGDLSKQSIAILKGIMVKKDIDNPYALVKDVIFKSHEQGDLRTSTALIMSLKNRGYFYVKTADEEKE